MSEEVKGSCSDISVDSSETRSARARAPRSRPRPRPRPGRSDELVLVPFYDGEVLISVRKDSKGARVGSPVIISQETTKKNDKPKKNLRKHPMDLETKANEPKNYLVNKLAVQKQRKNKTYLEKFREKLTRKHSEDTDEERDIESVQAEYGDTERESVLETGSGGSVTEFYNTECYNEVYYESLINREYDNYSNHFEKVECDVNERNVEAGESAAVGERQRSASEVARGRPGRRRAASDNVPSCRLGGLGPDMEGIRPRLERARSLQRYSEKVRIENKLKIYNKTLQDQEDASKYTRMRPRVQTATALKSPPKSSYLIQPKQEEPKKMQRDQNSVQSISRSESKTVRTDLWIDSKSVHRSAKSCNLANFAGNSPKTKLNESFGRRCVHSRGDGRQSDPGAEPRGGGAEGEGDHGARGRRVGRLARGEGALDLLEERHRLFREAVRKMCPQKETN